MRHLASTLLALALAVTAAHAQNITLNPFTTNKLGGTIAGKNIISNTAPIVVNSGGPVALEATGLIKTLSPINVFLNVASFGADATGVTDSTAAFYAATNVLQSGGTIAVPPGLFKCNLLINTPGIRIIGMGSSKQAQGTTFIANDPTKPIIQIGNDTVDLHGVDLDRFTLDGQGTAQEGLRLSGGARQLNINALTVKRFTQYGMHLEPGTNLPTTLVNINNCDVTCNSGSNLAGVLVRQVSNYPVSFLTAFTFTGNGHLDIGGTTNGYGLIVDSAEITWGWYGDLGVNGNGVQWLRTYGVDPVINMDAGVLDAAGSPQTVGHCWNNSQRYLDFLRGFGTVAGGIMNATNKFLQVYGHDFGSYQSFLSYPYITGTLNLQDPFATNAWDWNTDHTLSADHGDMVIRDLGRILMQPGNFTDTNAIVYVQGGAGIQSDKGGRFGGPGGVVAKVATLQSLGEDTNTIPLVVQGYSSAGVTAPTDIAQFKDPNATDKSVVQSDASFAPHKLVFQGVFSTNKLMLSCSPTYTSSSEAIDPFSWSPVFNPAANSSFNFYGFDARIKTQGTHNTGGVTGWQIVADINGTGTVTNLNALTLSLDNDGGGTALFPSILHIQNPSHAVGGTPIALQIDAITSGIGLYSAGTRNYAAGFSVNDTTDHGNELYVNGNIEGLGTIKTGNPTTGSAQTWNLGQVVTGATVTLVTTNYVSVNINGVAVKLAIVQ